MEKFIVCGHTMINHNFRSKLKISVNDYVILDFVAGCAETGKEMTEARCMTMLGLRKETVDNAVKSLLERGLVTYVEQTNMYYPYDEWWKVRKEKGHEFIALYGPVVIGEEVLHWGSPNRADTMKKLTAALKVSPIEQIVYAKLRYLIGKYVSKSLDWIMSSERFVGPDKHFLTEWKLPPQGEEILLDYCREHYWTGMEIDLSKMFNKEQVEEAKPADTKNFFHD